jgi:hypothetical protein
MGQVIRIGRRRDKTDPFVPSRTLRISFSYLQRLQSGTRSLFS